MSPAHRFLHADSAGGSPLPSLVPRPMDFFKLQDRFWQLDAEQSFSPAETRLYMYWLNRFNKEFWPASLPRTVKQVAADLGMDEKTIDRARKGLEDRTLITYQAGNKKVSAQWFLPAQVERKNSGQSAKNSPQIDRKISGANAGNSENSPQMDRKNSAPIYKEKTKTSSVVENKDEEERAASSSSSAEPALVEEIVTSQPASPNAEPQGTRGAAAGAAHELPRVPWSQSRYATLEGLRQLAHNLSFGKAYAPYYLAHIGSKAEDLPPRPEIGRESWKSFAQSYLTNDARSKTGLVTQDPLAGQPQTPQAGVGNLAARAAKQSQNDFL